MVLGSIRDQNRILYDVNVKLLNVGILGVVQLSMTLVELTTLYCKSGMVSYSENKRSRLRLPKGVARTLKPIILTAWTPGVQTIHMVVSNCNRWSPWEP